MFTPLDSLTCVLSILGLGRHNDNVRRLMCASCKSSSTVLEYCPMVINIKTTTCIGNEISFAKCWPGKWSVEKVEGSQVEGRTGCMSRRRLGWLQTAVRISQTGIPSVVTYAGK